jgi:hypothetical protein
MTGRESPRESKGGPDTRADGGARPREWTAAVTDDPSDPSDGPVEHTDGVGSAPEVEEGSATVKDQLVGTYMYLPETQVRHLRRRYNIIKAEYEFEYGEPFEKNRHFYPLVIKYGFDDLNELDTSQIRSRLKEL